MSNQQSPDWQDAKRISELPEVDEALRLFAQGESSEDQAVVIVQAVIAANEAERSAMRLDQVELAADALYKAGYTDRQKERDYDPRNTDEWQLVVDAMQAAAQQPAPVVGDAPARLDYRPAGADLYVFGVRVPDFRIGVGDDPRREAVRDEINSAALRWAASNQGPVVGVTDICRRIAEDQEVIDALDKFANDESDDLTIAWIVEAIVKRAVLALLPASLQAAQPAQPVQPLLVRDVAEMLGVTVHDVAHALMEMGHNRRSTNMEVTPDEAVAVAKRIAQPMQAVPDGWTLGITGAGEVIVRSPIDGPGAMTLPDGDEGTLPVRLLRALVKAMLAAAPAATVQAPPVSNGAVNMGAQALASELASAALKDDADPEGHDISAGLFGPNVSEWLRKVSRAYLGQPVAVIDGGILMFTCDEPLPDGTKLYSR